ncbi:MAG: zinc-binding alcohol dehydrogenase family protein [Gaiellaceae bacterium MAG52_C11]|nr:zinc-binding alcohol dehydrogenase family protein [Candidatus Gaiellasilicea maunaloa]
MELGRPPQAGEASEPANASLEVLAAAVNPIDRAVAAGQFYGGHPPLPFVPGCECVGRETGGRVVWTFGGGLGLARNGAMAERAELGSVVAEVPAGADPALAAALGIAGLAGWMPLAWRAPVREGDRVLVLGATGAAGQVALQAARLFGAEHIIAAGRDANGLARALELGADEAVPLDGDFGEPTYVFDPLCGEPLERAIASAASGARIVQLGQSAGPTATIPSAAVRGKQLELLGYSSFAVPAYLLAEHYRRLVEHALGGAIQVDPERIGLEEVGEAWGRRGKLVVCP